jgi:long-chain acyl-CoA synthetase
MDFTRLFDILTYQSKRFPNPAAFAAPGEGGAWYRWSTADALRERDHISAGLLHQGLHHGDRIGVLAHCGSPEWVAADGAIQQLGMVSVPIHATARPDEIAHIARDAELKACFVSNAAMLAKWQSAGVPVSHIFGLGQVEGTISWNELACVPDDTLTQKIQYYRDGVRPDDLATLLYTSGTTGIPKGVMLTHDNIVSNVKSVLTIVPVDHTTVALSFLPLSHILERMVLYVYQAAGVSVSFADAVERLPELLPVVRPHFFTAVPRILERSYERLIEQRKSMGWLGQKVFDWAIDLGERFPTAGLQWLPSAYRLQRFIADVLVYRHWRKALGGRVHGIAVGAAALQPRIGRLFSAAGIDVREGYGLTETSPVVAFNRYEPGGVHFGTVGIVAPGVEVRIAQVEGVDAGGEIEVRGPNVMKGYWNLPEETATRFTADGWFKTGDLGYFEHKRFLRITGRGSEVFKTSSGKFVAPAFVEQQLLQSPFFAQCLVLGLNKPYPGVLIVPNFDYLESWCKDNKIHWTAPTYMVHNPKVEKIYRAELDRIGQQLSSHEAPRTFQLIGEAWTTDNGLLTPTLKTRRSAIVKQHGALVEALFKGN